MYTSHLWCAGGGGLHRFFRFFTKVLRTRTILLKHVIGRHLSDNRHIKTCFIWSAIDTVISHDGWFHHFPLNYICVSTAEDFISLSFHFFRINNQSKPPQSEILGSVTIRLADELDTCQPVAMDISKLIMQEISKKPVSLRILGGGGSKSISFSLFCHIWTLFEGINNIKRLWKRPVA